MSLESTLLSASSGLASIQQRLAVVSQNVANAGTPGYAKEVTDTSARAAGGQGMGVASGPARRQLDVALQAASWAQDGVTTGSSLRSDVLAQVDAAQGIVGSGTSIADYTGALRDSFSALSGDPSSSTLQQNAVLAAGNLARSVRGTATAIGQQRQAVQDGLVADATAANTALGAVGKLSDQIISLRSQGVSSADLENQRDVQLGTLASLVSLKVLPQPNGDVTVATSNGLVLPTHAGKGPFAIEAAQVDTADAVVPALTLGGSPVDGASLGGRLGAGMTLRDTELPGMLAGLDEFSHTVADRFDAQGLTLFTAGGTGIPAASTTGTAQAGHVGLAAALSVNPAVVANNSLVRDGTHAVAGSATGASAFTPNVAGMASFGTLVTRVLNNTFGAEVQPGVSQTAPTTTGLGPNGAFQLGYAVPATLQGFASSMLSHGASMASDAADQAGQAKQTSTAFGTRISAGGVQVDQELTTMVQLQSAYAANAKVLTVVQQAWDRLLAAMT